MESLSVRGERELDLAEYGAAADRIGRLLQRLGLSRLARDVDKGERGLDVIMGRVNKLDGDEIDAPCSPNEADNG